MVEKRKEFSRKEKKVTEKTETNQEKNNSNDISLYNNLNLINQVKALHFFSVFSSTCYGTFQL